MNFHVFMTGILTAVVTIMAYNQYPKFFQKPVFVQTAQAATQVKKEVSPSVVKALKEVKQLPSAVKKEVVPVLKKSYQQVTQAPKIQKKQQLTINTYTTYNQKQVVKSEPRNKLMVVSEE